MGVFTIYDWGNGAAAQAATRILHQYGHVYIDQSRGRAFGLDQVHVRPHGQGWEFINQSDQPRTIRIVYDEVDTLFANPGQGWMSQQRSPPADRRSLPGRVSQHTAGFHVR
jgi:hypothetical protein